jgi:hypothetical protein
VPLLYDTQETLRNHQVESMSRATMLLWWPLRARDPDTGVIKSWRRSSRCFNPSQDIQALIPCDGFKPFFNIPGFHYDYTSKDHMRPLRFDLHIRRFRHGAGSYPRKKLLYRGYNVSIVSRYLHYNSMHRDSVVHFLYMDARTIDIHCSCTSICSLLYRFKALSLCGFFIIYSSCSVSMQLLKSHNPKISV